MNYKIIKFVFILFLIIFAFFINNNFKKNSASKNTLIISFCSISSDFLPIYNVKVEPNVLPNFNSIFSKSFNFLNSFSSTSWVNTGYYIFQKEYRENYGSSYSEYHPIMSWNAKGVSNLIMRIPPDKDTVDGYEDYYNEKRISLPFEDFSKNTEAIKKHFNQVGNQLFMLHFKLVHYPLLEESLLNNPNKMAEIFNKNELKLINNYLENSQDFPDKYPFFQYLFGIKKFEDKFKSSTTHKSFLTNFEVVNNWKKSQDYEIDREIIRKAYIYRLKLADQLLGKYLEFYKSIEENTTLVITGDHGETIGTRNYISHSETPFDEVIRLFTSIHFPFQNKQHDLKIQISQRTIGRLIEGIAQGIYNFSNINKLDYRPINDDLITSYNCSGDIASLRVKNKWKVIYYFQSDQAELFDLETDPLELINVAQQYPDLLEIYKFEIKDRIKDRVFSKNKCIK